MPRCHGCGALVPAGDGPVHPYVATSAGCWRLFGDVQADEAWRFGYTPANRVVVDAYMAQHPGDGSDRRDRQSVFVHLAGLCAVLEHGLEPGFATGLLSRVIDSRDDFPALPRAGGPGTLTVLHVVDAPHADAYERRAREWASAVWESWSDHHALVRAAVESLL